MKSNQMKFFVRNGAVGLMLLFFSGTILQSFLLAKGMSAARVGLITSVTYLLQILSTAVCSLFADRIRSIRSASAVAILPNAAFFLAMLPFCRSGDGGDALFFVTLVFLSILNIALAFKNLLDYKLPYLIFDMQQYGRMLATDGIITGVLSTGASLGLSALLKRADYFPTMAAAFFSCALLAVAASGITRSFHVIQTASVRMERPPHTCSLRALLHQRRFVLFIVPNFVRGLSMGLFSCVALFAAHDLKMDAAQSVQLVTVSTIAAISGNLIFAFTSGRKRTPMLCLVGSLTAAAGMAAMALTGFAPVYLGLYLLASVGMALSNGTIPVLVTYFVPYEEMGGYTSWRLILSTGGSALASALAGLLIGRMPSIVLFAVGAAGQVICGLTYFLFARQAKNLPAPD